MLENLNIFNIHTNTILKIDFIFISQRTQSKVI